MTGGETEGTTPAALVGGVRPKRAALDVLVQLVGRAANIVLGIAAAAVIARGLGDADYGVWTTVLLLPTLAANVLDLGLSQVALRLAAAEDEPRWLGAMVTARAALAVPTIALTLLALTLVGTGGDMFLAGAIVSAQALLAAPAALISIFQFKVRNDLTMIMLTVNSLLWTATVIVLMAGHHGIVALAVAMMAIATVTVGAQAVLALRLSPVPLRGTRALWWPLVRMAAPVGAGALLIVAYARIDGIIVYRAAGAVDAGLYGAVYRILDQAMFVPLSLTVTLAPVIARVLPAHHEEGRRLLQLALDLLSVAALFAIAFSLVASRDVVTFLYGADFAPAAGTLPVLMLVFALTCCGFVFGLFTLVLELQRRFAVYALIGLAVNVGLNLWLVPRHGFRAAAWVTVVTEAVVSGLIGYDIFWRLQMRLALGRITRVAVAAAATAGMTLTLKDLGAGLVVLLPAALVVHLVLVVLLGGVSVGQIRHVLARDPLGAAS